MKTINDILAIGKSPNSSNAYLFNVNIVHTIDGDILLEGDAGEEVRIMRRIVSAHNRQAGTTDTKYRIALQGRLGPGNPNAYLYANRSNTRIKLKHAGYAGVYIWTQN